MITPSDDYTIRVAGLAGLYLRQTSNHYLLDGVPTWEFDPPLTASEQTTFDDIKTFAKLGVTNDLTLAEFRAIKPQLAEIRTLRTRSLSEWNALTAAQREADEIRYSNDLADVLRALLRA